jgi:hypothetical protein
VFVVSVQVEEPADFGERQWDQASPYSCGFLVLRFVPRSRFGGFFWL